MPDGTILVNVPDGTPKDEIMRRYQARSGQDLGVWDLVKAAGKAATNSAVPPMLAGLQHWAPDLAMGAAGPILGGVQAAGHAMGVPGADTPVNMAEAAYAGTNPEDRFGAGAMRAGGALAYGPLLSRLPVPASIGGRMGQGAGIGAVAGALEPVKGADQQDFGQAKGMQTGMGAALGFMAPPILEPAIAGAGKLVKVGADAARRLMGGGASQIDPEMAARAARFAQAGVNPTAGQVTRDPAQWAAERNLAGVQGVDEGGALSQRFGGQAPALRQSLEGTTQGTVRDPMAANQNAIDALKKMDDVWRGKVDKAYNAARDKVGGQTEVPMQPIADALGRLEETARADQIPLALMHKMEGYGLLGGKQTRAFNVRDANNLRQAINANYDRIPGDVGRALKGAIDEAEGMLGDQGHIIGADAAQAFRDARALAQYRKQTYDAAPGLEAVRTGKAVPDDFIEKYVLKGSATVDQTRKVMEMLASDPAAKADAQSVVVRHLLDKAGENFSQAAYNRALNDIGERKLAEIFDPKDLQRLKLLGQVAHELGVGPAEVPVNRSKTAPAMLGMLQQVPILGRMMRGAATGMQRGQVATALQPPNMAPLPNPDVAAEMRRRLGLLGPWLGGSNAPSN